jgi:hypothetical protein
VSSQYIPYSSRSGSGGGSSGPGTIIPNNGSLTGSYTGDVIVTGNGYLTGNVTVNGDLFVENSLFSPSGYSLTVLGDCFITGGFNWNTTPSTTPVGSLTVNGDLISGYLNNPVTIDQTILNTSQVSSASSTTVFTVNASTHPVPGLQAGDTINWITGPNVSANPFTVMGVAGGNVITLTSPTPFTIGVNNQFHFTSNQGFTATGYPQVGATVTWLPGSANAGSTSVIASIVNVNRGVLLVNPTTNPILPADTFSYVQVESGASLMQPSTGSDGTLTVGNNFLTNDLTGDSLTAGVPGLSGYIGGQLLGNTGLNADAIIVSAAGSADSASAAASAGGSWLIQGGIQGLNVSFQLNGGTAGSFAAPGGAGGSLSVDGLVIGGFQIIAIGGSSSSSQAGGAGGSVSLNNGVSGGRLIDVSGGSSSSGTGGSAGILSMPNGGTVGQINAVDGSGTAATAIAGLRIGGYVDIWTLNTTNRAHLTIAPTAEPGGGNPDYPPPVLRANVITGKTTLANAALTLDTFAIPGTYAAQLLTYNYVAETWGLVGSGSGTVSSVALADTTGLFTVSGSPVTSTGTIDLNTPNTLTVSTVLVTDSGGHIGSSTTTSTELGYVHGVTSAIQTQLNAKQATGNYITALTGDVTASGPGSSAATLAATSNATLTSLSALTSASALATVGTVTSGTWSSTVHNASVTGSLKDGNYHIEPSETSNSASTSATTIDLSAAAAQSITLSSNTTLTLSNPQVGGAYVLRIVQGSSSYTVAWPASVLWSGGTTPVITTTNAYTDVVNLYWDGTFYYGTISQNYAT